MPAASVRPSWLSSELYPFESRFFSTAAGSVHYIDEGEGKPLVFVHGNPSWSFEFRHIVKALRNEYRCIAIDHLGFGLSGKDLAPEEWPPQRHAARLGELLRHLGLERVTLVLADWGGPIGLDFAVKHPDLISGLVLFNTFAWPVNDDRHFRMFSRMMASRPGQFLIRHGNIFVNFVLPGSVGVKKALTPCVMKHYRGPMATPADRSASAALPRHIMAAGPWLDEIWRQRDRFADKPALVIWGGSDIAFRLKEFDVWKAALRHGTFHYHKSVGHLVAEEIPDVSTGHIRDFLNTMSAS
nr:alpha/beta fold hydrolase [uncultured Rhodopila sp.]